MNAIAGLCIMVGLIFVGNSLRVIAQAIAAGVLVAAKDKSSSLNEGDKK